MTNGELHVGEHVIFHDSKHGVNRDALILVIFHQNGPPPPLTLIMVRPGERGPAVKSMVPHRDDIGGSRAGGYWLLPAECELDT